MFDVIPPSVTALEMATDITLEDWKQMPSALQLTSLCTRANLPAEALCHLNRAVHIQCESMSLPLILQLPALVPKLQILSIGIMPRTGLALLAALPSLKDLTVRRGCEDHIDLRQFPSLVQLHFLGKCNLFEAGAGSSSTCFFPASCHIVWSKA